MDSRVLILHLSEWLGVIAVIMIAGLSPRLKVKPVGFLYPRREGLVALSLYLLIFLFQSLVASGSLGWVALSGLRSGAPQARMLVGVLSLAPVAAVLWLRRQPVRSAGWYRVALGGAFRTGIALVVLTIILRGKTLTLLNGITPQEARLLFYWLVICLAEETIFRGYIQLRLSSWLGETWGLLATSLLFLAWQWPFLAVQSSMLAVNLLVAIARALVAGWVAQKSKHVIAPILYRLTSEWLYFIS